MKRNIGFWQWVGFFAVSATGTVLHFLYDWTKSPIAALISGVNESTWEHMKLLFFPMFLFAIIEYFKVGKDYKNFWCIKLKGVLLGLLLIPVCFYTLNGVFGKTPDWINIGIFFVSVAGAFIYESKQFEDDFVTCKSEKTAISIFVLIAVAFFIFTFLPPRLPLFQDPVDGSFGM